VVELRNTFILAMTSSDNNMNFCLPFSKLSSWLTGWKCVLSILLCVITWTYSKCLIVNSTSAQAYYANAVVAIVEKSTSPPSVCPSVTHIKTTQAIITKSLLSDRPTTPQFFYQLVYPEIRQGSSRVNSLQDKIMIF